ncbi:MAG TPA: META domain-containing protein [Thermoanaerobaculia bacterium]|jgi:putative lipoprotein|nr:META domain-containing protein [Thermoanaerobaculia bacterium]
MSTRAFFQLSAVLSLIALLGCAVPSPAAGQTPGKGGEGMTPMDALEGKTWTLVQFDDGSLAPAERAITAVFGGGKVSGSGGCNRYSASVTSSAPGALKVGAISATKMACMGAAGTNEQRYFAALEKVESFALEDGRLVLNPGKMVFKAGAPP